MSITVTKETYCVYKHTSPSGKVYIGVTCHGDSLNKRWNSGHGYRFNKHFYNAIKKYGWHNIKHEVVMVDLNDDDAARIEIELIQQYQSNLPEYGYNISIGGGLWSDVTRKKASATQIVLGRQTNVRAKRSATMKAMWKSPELREKLVNAAKLNAQALEARERVSAQSKALWQNPEHRVMMSEATKRSWENLEIRAKRVENIGKPVRLIETDAVYYSASEAHRMTGIIRSGISQCCRGKRLVSGGYHWEYVNNIQL